MTDVKTMLQQDITRMPDGDPLLGSRLAESPAVVAYLASVAMTAVATVIAVAIDSGVAIPNLSLLFVVPVIIAGLAFGLGASLCAAVLGALAFNFFLTEPRYSLVVDDPANIWAIGLLFIVGLIVSGVAHTSRRRAADAALLRRQATALQDYSREVVAADTVETIVSATSRALYGVFQVPAVVMLVAESKVVSVNGTGDLELQQTDFEAARSALAMGAAVRAGIHPASAARFDFWPVRAASGQRAVIGLAFDPDERPPTPDTAIDIIGNLLALALDRQDSPDGGAVGLGH